MRGSDNRRPSALILSPEAPYPLDGGGALRTASLIHYFAQCYDVDLIAFQHPGQRVLEALPAGLVRHARTIPLRKHGNSFAKKAGRNAGRLIRGVPPLMDRFSGYEDTLEKLLADRTYDVALLEHFWCASYLPSVRRVARQVILDLHNVESSWHRSCAGVAPFPQSAVHRCFGRAAWKLERAWLPRCDLALAASTQDAALVGAISPGTRVCVYPNAIPDRNASPITPEFALAFSANMEYEPNRTGVSWFARKVWPGLRNRFPGLRLLLIGKNPHAIAPAIRNLAGVECTGWVADTYAHLGRAQVCIAPLLSGSGTRLKILEAWAAERPVVSTQLGAAGLDAVNGESIILADTPDHFSKSIECLLTHPELRQKIAIAGRELFQQKYTWKVAWTTLNGCIDKPSRIESA